MQRNSTTDTLTFAYTIANLDWNREPFYWTHITTDQLIQNVLQNYLSNEAATKRSLQVWIIRLMFENTKLHNMIDSEDDDISQLAIQMLFNDHLDLYNKLDATGFYKYTLHEYPKGLTYYRGDWYKKYCYVY